MANPDVHIAGPAAASLTRSRRFMLTLSRLWAWAFLGLMIVFFVIAVPVYNGGSVNFLTVRNSQNILLAITPVLLLGLGQTFVIISAGIDLSVGWVMSLASVLSALAIRAAFNSGLPLFPSVVIGFLAAVAGAGAVGLINGTIIAKLKVPAFIVTLGTSFIVRGVGAADVGEHHRDRPSRRHPRLRQRGADLFHPRRGRRALLPRAAGADRRDAPPHGPHPRLSGGRDGRRRGDRGLHPAKTQFGRHTYAIGGNIEAALRAGIPVDRRIIQIYMLSAITAGIGGFLSTLRFTAGSAVIGDPLLLSSIAAVIIGGVSLFGGAGSVMGTVIGSLIIAVLTTGLVMLNVQAFWQFIVVGVVVIVAVLIDQSRDLIMGRDKGGPLDMTEPVLSIRSLTKRFGGLTAVNGVSWDIFPGEVVALLGDNGAGKSTLIKCISGVYQPDEGEIFFEGRQSRFARPIDARQRGDRDDLPGPRARQQSRRRREHLSRP